MATTLLSGIYIRSGSIPPHALSGGVVSSSAQINTGSFSGSLIGTSSWATNAISASFATSASWAPIPVGTVSSSAQISTGSFTGSFTGSLLGTASLAQTSSNLIGGTTNYIPLWASATAQSSSNIYQNAGNIGIGTTSPTSGSRLEIAGSGVWDGGTLTLRNTGTGGRTWTVFSTNNSFVQGPGRLLIFNTTADVAAVTIDPTSRVGIGTTFPSASLHVNGGKSIITSDDGVYGQIQINSSTTSTEASLTFSAGGSGVNTGQYTNFGGLGIGAYGNTTDTLVIGTAAAIAYFRNGTLGLGARSNGIRLYVSGSGSQVADFRYQTNPYLTIGDGTTTSLLGIADASAGTASYGFTGTLTNSTYVIRTNNLNRVFVSSSGNVGIGVSVPGATLHVQGNVSASAFTGSIQYANIVNVPSGIISSSAQINTGSFTGSFTGSLLGTSSWATNAITASYALSASYAPIPAGTVSSSLQINTGSFSGSFIGTASIANEVTGGSARYIPLWNTDTSLSSSLLYQTGSSVLLGATTQHTPEAPDRFGVFAGVTDSYNLISAHGETDQYLQLNVKNFSSGQTASSDVVATADTGNELGGYIDFGINSSNYALVDGIGGPLDGYLYVTGSDLLIGNTSPDKRIILFTGGGNAANNARVYIDASGSVGINTQSPTVGNPEALVVDAITNSYNLITARGNLDNYTQINIKNLSGGNSASADLVATANNGTETSNYIDMGINSDQYNQTGVVGGPNDAYLYSTGNMLHIGNATENQHIMFFAGGIDAEANKKLQLDANNQHTLSGSLNVTGSVNVLDGVINNLTASYALTASVALNLPSTIVSSSEQINTGSFSGSFIGSLIGTSSWATTASYVIPTGLPNGTISSSTQVDYTQIQNTPSTIATASYVEYTNVVNKPTLISASSQIQLDAVTGTTFSNAAFLFPQGLTVGGTLTAQEIRTEYITSSVIYESGSTKFGDSTDDTHQFTGSLSVLGSITGSVFGTSSWANDAISASFATSASWAPIPAGTVSSSTQFSTGSFTGSFTGSLLGTSSWAISSSFATTASAATSITFTPSTASYASTSSNLLGGATNYIPLWTRATAQSSSNIFQSASNIGIGTTTPTQRLEINGNLYITGSGRRILGDFTSAPISSRSIFQTNITNGLTAIYAIPNGTNTTSGFTATNNSDADNAGIFQFVILNTDARVYSSRSGTGTFVPLTLWTSNTERIRVDVNGATTMSGDLHITGSGRRIIADFTTSSLIDRAMFQTSVTNGNSNIYVIPNGTATNTSFTVVNDSDPTDAGIGQFVASLSDIRLLASRTGTGTYLPLVFHTSGSEKVRVTVEGRVGVGTTTPSASLQVQGNISASSYTSSISNAVGFLGTSSWAVSASWAPIPAGTVSSSTQFSTGSFTGSFTGSLLGTSSWANFAVTSSNADLLDGKDSTTFATTGSNTFVGNQIISGSLITTADTMNFNGAMSVSGSVSVTGSISNVSGGITGSLFGTSSWANNAISASWAPIPVGTVSSSAQISTGSFTGSFTGSLLGTSSWATNAISSSFAITASTATSITFTPETASYALTASFIDGGFY